jgi:hypothetical protein
LIAIPLDTELMSDIQIEPTLNAGSADVEWELDSMTMHGTLVRPQGEGSFPGRCSSREAVPPIATGTRHS